MKHVLQQFTTSDVILHEFINAEGKQVLHLYLTYHDERQNYTISYETNRSHIPIDENYKNELINTMRGLE